METILLVEQGQEPRMVQANYLLGDLIQVYLKTRVNNNESIPLKITAAIFLVTEWFIEGTDQENFNVRINLNEIEYVTKGVFENE